MDISEKKVTILGATSHIAKGLIYNFSINGKHELFLFARSLERLSEFLKSIQCEKNVCLKTFSQINDVEYDVIINCVGIGEPARLKNDILSILRLTENFDNLVLDYLDKHRNSLYINFSSGATYGTDFSQPVNESTLSKWDINNISESDYYGIAKLDSEAKHRALKSLNIVDLRIFSYFSRFINIESKFLLTEIISCIKEGREFITDSQNIVRDYIHPKDLLALIERCIEKHNINDVFDAYSLKPITKFEILNYFASQYHLKYTIKNDVKFSAITGCKDNYYSLNRKAQQIGYIPQFNSMDSIIQESKEILDYFDTNL